MTRRLVLDSSALDLLAGGKVTDPSRRTVHAALKAAANANGEVVVPAAVLSELYRGGQHDKRVDSCLGRETGIRVVDTTRRFALRVGHLLARAGRGSADHVDATVVAAAASAQGGVILTSDPDDIRALAAAFPGLKIVPI